MIVDERMVTYIRSLERPENPVIEAIEQEALENFVPIIRKETQRTARPECWRWAQQSDFRQS